MSSTGEAPHLIRLGDVLEQREAPVLPVLTAVTVSGASSVHLAASARGRRLDLLMPFNADALHAIAPGVAPPPVPPRSMIRISIDGDALGAALVVVGAVAPRAAVDELATYGARDRWIQVLEPMCSVAGGAISSRTRSLTAQRATVAVRYPPRTAADDERLVQEIDKVAARLGIDKAQREMWRKIHRTLGADVVTVATQCSPAGPVASVAFMYLITEWERAIELTQRIADIQVARQAALALGTLAGTLQSDHPWAIELVFGEHGPDVVAWCTVRPSEPTADEPTVKPTGPKPRSGAGEVTAQEIARLAAELANRIEKESTPGADLEDEITQPLPPLHDQMGAGELNFGGREPPDPVRDLELRVETVSTNHGSAQIIRRGTESEVATWLRSPEAAVHIIAVMKELAEHLARKGRA